jgi:cell division transport system permease protein
VALNDLRHWRRLSTALRSGLRSARTNPVVFTTSVATTAAGLVLLGALLLIVINMRNTLARFGGGVNVVAFLPLGQEPDTARIDALRAGFAELPGVEEVAFVSSETALARLREDLGGDFEILEELQENPLPASFELRLAAAAASPENLRALASRVARIEGVEDTRYGEEWVQGYERALRTLEQIGLILGLGLLISLGFMVGGTVRLAVHARQDEIQIQRLVGASGLYVRLPFYVQGAMQGLVGGLLAMALLYAGFRFGLPLLADSLQFLAGREWVFLGPLWSLGLCGLGMSLGLLSAVLSLLNLEEAS